MRRIRTIVLKQNHVKKLAAIALIAMSQASFAEQYEVELTAQVGPYCVLSTPTAAQGSTAFSSITETKSTFEAIVGEDGKALSTISTLIFSNAYCNGNSRITLSSANENSVLSPGITTVPDGFAPSIEYMARATWGESPSVSISPGNPSAGADLPASSGDITLYIEVSPTDLPLADEIYNDSIFLTVAVGP